MLFQRRDPKKTSEGIGNSNIYTFSKRIVHAKINLEDIQ